MVSRKKLRRRGAAAVETALVIIPLFMLMMGVFEFGRMVMSWNVLNNAAREGCRYALVNNTSSTISSDVTTQVKSRMAGLDARSFSLFSVTVSGTHNGVSTPVNSLVAGDLITVTVTGTFNFMNALPFVTFPSITITSAPTMVCEGVT